MLSQSITIPPKKLNSKSYMGSKKRKPLGSLALKLATDRGEYHQKVFVSMIAGGRRRCTGGPDAPPAQDSHPVLPRKNPDVLKAIIAIQHWARRLLARRKLSRKMQQNSGAPVREELALLRENLRRISVQRSPSHSPTMTKGKLSVKSGFRDAVEVSQGNNVISTKDEKGNTPLYYAVKSNRLWLCEHLILKGADVNARNEGGNTALHAAMQTAREELASLLIEHGADLHATNDRGETPVVVAPAAILRGLRIHRVPLKAAKSRLEGKPSVDLRVKGA